MDVQHYMRDLGQRARNAASAIALAPTSARNGALLAIAERLAESVDSLLEANAQDMDAARHAGLDAAMLDRLSLTPASLEGLQESLRQVAALADPIGEISGLVPRESGIRVGRMRVPLGVIGMIYESRPSVTCEASSLAIKSGNALILRGGSEALHSNRRLAACVGDGLRAAGLPSDAVQLVDTTDRAAVGAMLGMADYLDVIVPRGGKDLVARVDAEARVPVIKHLDGNCHVYIDAHADLERAGAIALNAKTQRCGVCNALETLLVDAAVAGEALPGLGAAFAEHGVALRACPAAMRWLPEATAASEEDWATEYLAPILAVRVVDGLEAAIEHINRYGSGHTDCIVTEHYGHALRFLRAVDSASVMVNASTRFADGFEYGLGAEIGISTDKLHARGPVGLEGLTSQKYVVLGNGEVRA